MKKATWLWWEAYKQFNIFFTSNLEFSYSYSI